MVLELSPDILAKSDVELAAVIEDRGHPAISRRDAIRAIQTKPTERGVVALAGVLAEDAEPIQLRVAATLALSRFAPDLAEPPLRDAVLRSREPRIIRNALRSLGRIGGRESIASALEVEGRVVGALAVQARYAAMLIAYRHRLLLPNLEPVRDLRTLSLDRRASVEVEIRRMSETEGGLAIAQVMEDPIGVDLDPGAAFEDLCGGLRRLIALARAFSGPDGPTALARGPAVLGVIGSWSEAGNRFSSGQSLLATPNSDGGGWLHVHNARGEPRYYGRYTGSSFRIASVDRPGGVPMERAGSYDSGELVLETGATALRSDRKLQPAPFVWRG